MLRVLAASRDGRRHTAEAVGHADLRRLPEAQQQIRGHERPARVLKHRWTAAQAFGNTLTAKDRRRTCDLGGRNEPTQRTGQRGTASAEVTIYPPSTLTI